MSEEIPSYDVTIPGTDPATIPPWPLSNIGPDGTTYWVDSTGRRCAAPRPYQDAPCWIVWQSTKAELLLASFDPKRVLDFLATNLADGVRLFKVVRFE